MSGKRNLVVIAINIILIVLPLIPGNISVKYEQPDDPTSLLYSTFLGGSEYDCAISVGTDALGCKYILGYTASLDFPSGDYSLVSPNASMWWGYVVITKMDPDCKGIIYSTVLGKGEGNDLIVDPSGNAIITGTTPDPTFPTTNDGLDTSFNGLRDCFLTRLDENGDLDYSSFIGGSEEDEAWEVEFDEKMNIWITGVTNSTDFPGSYGSSHNNRTFLIKFDYGLNSMDTFFFSFGNDSFVRSMEMDAGKIFIGGFVSEDVIRMDTDAFMAVIRGDDGSLEYSKVIGGSNREAITIISIDRSRMPLFAGYTYSEDFPTTEPKVRPSRMSSFIIRTDRNGTELDSTLFEESSVFCDILHCKDGSTIYVGIAYSGDFPTTPGAYDTEYHINGHGDMFLTMKDPTGTKTIYSTYFGGGGVYESGSDSPSSVLLDMDGDLWIVGQSSSSDLPTTENAFDRTYNGGIGDAVICEFRLSDHTNPTADAGPDIMVPEGTVHRFDGSNCSDNLEVVNWTWSIEDPERTVLYGPDPNIYFARIGLYVLTLLVRDEAGNIGFDASVITVGDRTPPKADAGPDIIVDEGTIVVFDGSGSTDNTDVVSWNWSILDGSRTYLIDGHVGIYRFERAGMYVVVLTVSDMSGNTDTDSLVVRVVDATPPIVDAGRDLMIHSGTRQTLNSTSSHDNVGITNWTWVLELDSLQVILYGPTIEYEFSIPGKWNVTLVVRDGAGNQGRDNRSIEVLIKEDTPEDKDPSISRELFYVAIPPSIALIIVAIAWIACNLVKRRSRGM